MNINFGLFPPFEKRVPKRDRRKRVGDRALRDLDSWIEKLKLPAEQINI